MKDIVIVLYHFLSNKISEIIFFTIALSQRFSTFWYSHTPKLMVYPLCVIPNKSLTQIVPHGQKISMETVVAILF
jgi:hypothetical protein